MCIIHSQMPQLRRGAEGGGKERIKSSFEKKLNRSLFATEAVQDAVSNAFRTTSSRSLGAGGKAAIKPDARPSRSQGGFALPMPAADPPTGQALGFANRAQTRICSQAGHWEAGGTLHWYFSLLPSLLHAGSHVSIHRLSMGVTARDLR